MIEEDSFEYEGALALCKDSGSPPAPVDPYAQAAAQYGLDTGTAQYNAGLNRTNSVNPIGSQTWSSTGGGNGGYAAPGTAPAAASGSSAPQPYYSGANGLSGAGLLGTQPPPTDSGANTPGQGLFSLGGSGMPISVGGGPPTYTNTTQLAPQFQSPLEQPIDTSGIAGMPGGPSTTQDLQNTQASLYNQQMAYLQPQEQLAGEQLDSQLANSGATVGSAAWNNAKDQQARANSFTNNQAINSAITGGGAEQSRLFGLGTQSLQSQITARDAPINEYNSLNGSAGATANAQTPDITGAFGQQYQGALAGYNANVASGNADTSAAGSLAAAALIYF